MLVLSRKSRESVVIGRSSNGEPILTVTVLEIRGTRVKLGFDVTDDVPVHRGEVWARISGNDRADDVTPGPTGRHPQKL